MSRWDGLHAASLQAETRWQEKMKLGKARIQRATFGAHMFLEMKIIEAVSVIVGTFFFLNKKDTL